MADTKAPARGNTTLPVGSMTGPGGKVEAIPPGTLPLGRTAAPRDSAEEDLARTVEMPWTPPDAMGPPDAPEWPTAPDEPPRVFGGIEMLVVDEHELHEGERKPWRAGEVWTKRRIYGLDSTFRCVEILDRETGRPEATHDMLGARLGGGRRRDHEQVHFSYPLPLPGMEAMFSKGKQHGYTSVVERMVVRVRVLHTSADAALPSWDEIASRWSDPPPHPSSGSAR